MLLDFESNMHRMTRSIRSYPWSDPYAYGMYLAQTYYYVCHSTRLLVAAAGRMSQADNAFHKRFLEHAGEEKAHELLALRDLKALGFTLEDFPELPETRMFWETQYYKIEHKDPLSLLGYIIALEAIACQECPWVKDQVVSSHQSSCYSFVKLHGEEDPDHVKKAMEQICSLPPDRLKWVQENFEQTSVGLYHLLERMKAESQNHISFLVA